MPRCELCRLFGHEKDDCVRSYAAVTGGATGKDEFEDIMDEEEAEVAAGGSLPASNNTDVSCPLEAEAAKDTTPSPPATPSAFPVSTAPGKGDTTNGSAEVNASSKTASNRQEDRPTGQGQSTDVKPMQAAPKDTGTAVPEFMIREDWAGTNEDGQRLPDQRLKWIPVSQRNFRYDPKTRVPPEARRQKDFP